MTFAFSMRTDPHSFKLRFGIILSEAVVDIQRFRESFWGRPWLIRGPRTVLAEVYVLVEPVRRTATGPLLILKTSTTMTPL